MNAPFLKPTGREIGLTLSGILPGQARSGDKTETRRIINPQPVGRPVNIGEPIECRREAWVDGVTGEPIVCPWEPGDHLYVREAYFAVGRWDDVPGVKTRTGKQKRKFTAYRDDAFFIEPSVYLTGPCNMRPGQTLWFKRLARFMPKRYARTWLEVIDVKAQRLHEITEEDAVAEGVIPRLVPPDGGAVPYVDAFKEMWVVIHRQESWDANPWVWVVKFRRIDKATEE